ncbi:MAG: hypothetical protein IIZ48_02210, partial [Erysipelotrichales bacterium]|nr:hypothetical protein [Erysipelotrichales bacterium]MBQ1505561.1 hypothetical protein [Erysipelotrichales bacterium]
MGFFEGLLLHELFEKTKAYKKPYWVFLCTLYIAGYTVAYAHGGLKTEYSYYLLNFTVLPCVMIIFKGLFILPVLSNLSLLTLGKIS